MLILLVRPRAPEICWACGVLFKSFHGLDYAL